jgi:catechol 2,3-dioxygenase-like lactoylglutathione lyase family enzyme
MDAGPLLTAESQVFGRELNYDQIMEVEAIDHVQLAMPAGQEDRARVFYTGVLGIPEVAKPAELAARGGAWFERGSLKIHLGVEADFRPAKKAHPGLRVTGLSALLSRCRAAGYAVTEAPARAGSRNAFVEDPFGNRVELLELDG